jgi:1-acyl-sn-glycerol-3-phosphate acyltransferase
MLRLLKVAALLLLFAVFLVAAVFIRLAIPLLGLPRLRTCGQVMCCFTTILKILLNVRTSAQGEHHRFRKGGYFIISNHLGYLDGIVLGSLCPVIFLTKREVRHWPVIGQLLTLLGTVFVERQDKKEILPVVNCISKNLKAGANVLLFPEGTSTNGENLVPFQSAFFAAALMARALIVPMTLSYRFVDHEPVQRPIGIAYTGMATYLLSRTSGSSSGPAVSTLSSTFTRRSKPHNSRIILTLGNS